MFSECSCYSSYLHDVSYCMICFQVSCMERCFTSSRSTEMATLTASWDTQSTSGSTLCSWMCCGSSYRWCSLWTHGDSCQPPRRTLTTQSHTSLRGTDSTKNNWLWDCGTITTGDMIRGERQLGKNTTFKDEAKEIMRCLELPHLRCVMLYLLHCVHFKF